MGDYTAMTFTVPNAPKELIAELDELFNEYGSESADERHGMHIWQSGDVRCGSASDLADDMDKLREEGTEGDCPDCTGYGEVQRDHEGLVSCERCNGNGSIKIFADLAYEVYEDPKYEWLGDLYIYVPGLGRFSSECDANGSPVVKPETLLEVLDAAETLEEARAKTAAMTGSALRPFFTEDGNAPKLELVRTRERDENGNSIERLRHQVVT